MSKNSNRGAYRLADVLQKRMKKVSSHSIEVSAELGEIASGNKLKLDSLPEATLDKDDYSVCKTIADTDPLKKDDRVLVVWTDTGEPVVIDKIVSADKL